MLMKKEVTVRILSADCLSPLPGMPFNFWACRDGVREFFEQRLEPLADLPVCGIIVPQACIAGLGSLPTDGELRAIAATSKQGPRTIGGFYCEEVSMPIPGLHLSLYCLSTDAEVEQAIMRKLHPIALEYCLESQFLPISQTLNNVNAGYLLISSQGVILDFNQHFASLESGSRPLFCVGGQFVDLFAPAIHGRIGALLADVLQNKYSRQVLHFNLDAGQPSAYLASLALLPNGAVGIIANNISDIVERQNTLLKSQERVYFAMFASNDGIWDWDLITNKVIFSDRWKSMIGYEPQEIENDFSEWKRLVHPDDLQPALAQAQAHISGRTPFYAIEHRLQCKDGSYKWILARGKIVEWNIDGLPIRFVGTHSDIADRKSEEASLRMSEAHYRMVINTMNEGLVVQNSEGVIIDCNDAAHQILGLSRSQMEGRSSIDPRWKAVRENGEDFPGHQHPAMITLATGKPQHNVVMGVHKPNGELTWISINSQLMPDPEGKGTRMAATTFADITDMLSYSQRLKESNESKNKLFSIIAHDLKNPFNAILALSEGLDQRTKDDPQLKEINYYCSAINKASVQAYNLLNTLLEWAKSQSSGSSFAPKEINAYEAATESIMQVQESAHMKSVAIIPAINESSLIYADKNMLIAIFRNLLSNAIKYSHHNSSVTISAMRGSIDTIFCVSDEGIGIPYSRISGLFSLAGNESSRGTDNETGTGLGLSLCKELVSKHGGQIWAENNYPRGASFYFTIPNMPI